MLWGGGYLAQEGALDFSGGFVIHMSAGVSGFVAAWVLGPRLARDRQHFVPNNLLIAAVGAGILWLGWNGFNGGDPYYAGIDMSNAVVNTNIATAVGVLTWMAMDGCALQDEETDLPGRRERHDRAAWSASRRVPVGSTAGVPSWSGRSTPSSSGLRGTSWSKVRPFSKVDDALGVIYTHGIAGFFGGLFLGVFGDPNMIEYGCGTLDSDGQVVNTSNGHLSLQHHTVVRLSRCSGLMYTGSFHQLWEQFRAAIFVIIWSALITFILMKLIGLVLRGARYKDEMLEVGDVAIHDEEAYPVETLAERVGALSMAGAGAETTSARSPDDPSPG